MRLAWAVAQRALFALPAETSHRLTLVTLAAMARAWPGGLELFSHRVRAPCNPFGVPWANPVGLAAGLDKDGECIDAWAALGFGSVEVGTVTPRPQPGNPRPRLFRLPDADAIINRMGFNNRGVDHLVRRLRAARREVPVGVNIGKNRDTPLASAVDDYRACLAAVHAEASWVTVNLSSPNTPGLRDLQAEAALRALVEPLLEDRARLSAGGGRHVPLLVKLAPDLDAQALIATAGVLESLGVDGIVATNTTLTRPQVAALEHADEAGGLSGAPLHPLALAAVAALRSATRLPIVGVGGICEPRSATAMLDAGASCLQLYTGFIYHGPPLLEAVVRTAAARLRLDMPVRH